MKLLLVEDNPENWDMLSRRLRTRGYEVTIAEDGQRALNTATSEPHDLILLDMGLPEMSGGDVARALRSNPATRAIPIIALTAHASLTDRDEALASGCNEFETKPVNLDRLLEKINKLSEHDTNSEVAEYKGPQEHSERRHAFLDPLNHIVGFTSLLLEELDHLSPDEIRSDLNKVRSAARILVDLVTNDSLPAERIERRGNDAEQEQPASRPGASILVVDDDINNRILIVRNLRKHGYKVAEAIDGDDALQMIRKETFDLVLCDIVMPRMDGVDLLRHIRSEFGDGLSVIVISALDQIETVQQCLDLDAIDFISKPFEPSILLAKVGAVIRRQRKHAKRASQLL